VAPLPVAGSFKALEWAATWTFGQLEEPGDPANPHQRELRFRDGPALSLAGYSLAAGVASRRSGGN
jgi:hypothetical protein